MKSIVASIYNEPQQWRRGQFCLEHKNGIRIWICNGLFFIKIQNSDSSLSFMQRYRIWKAYKWWRNEAPMDALNGKFVELGDAVQIIG